MILDRMFSMPTQADPPRPGGGRSVLFGPAPAGVRVDEQTALNYSAVFASIRTIAETISGLSWRVFERMDDSRRELPDHPAMPLLHVEPNPEMTPSAFRETLIGHVLTWGNGFAEIERVGAVPVALWPITPNRVKVSRNDAGRLVYEVKNDAGAPTVIPAEDMFHVKGLAFDGIVGYSPIALARQSISLGLAAETFGASFYGNGTHPAGVLETDEQLSDQGYKNLRESWERAHRGPGNAQRPAILEQGLKWKTISVPPEEAQFLETRKFQVAEIARWFRIPPHKLGDLERATFSNIEEQSRAFVTDAIMPWIVRFEEEANRKLLATSERTSTYTKMNVNGLLRGDTETRGTFYRVMTDIGVMSINDVRRSEDMNPIDGGDIHTIQANRTLLSSAGNAAEPVEDQDDEEAVAALSDPRKAIARVFADVSARMVHIEADQCKAKSRKHDLDGFREWADDFYAKFRSRLVNEMDAPATALAELMVGSDRMARLGSVVSDQVSAWAVAHVEQSKESVLSGWPEVDRVADQWEIDRPAEIASALPDRIVNAVQAKLAEEGAS